jgi:hypothetical protein
VNLQAQTNFCAAARPHRLSAMATVIIMTCEAVAHDGLLVVLQCGAVNASSSARYL